MVLERANGEPLELASFRGRAVLLVAFTMDDMNSQATLRHVEELVQAHPEDLAAVAISGDRHPHWQHRQLLRVFAGVLELSRTEVVLADDALRDGATPLGAIEHVPTVFLVNRAGVIARRLEGYQGRAELEALVTPALPRR
jgi:peroxiredoxin